MIATRLRPSWKLFLSSMLSVSSSLSLSLHRGMYSHPAPRFTNRFFLPVISATRSGPPSLWMISSRGFAGSANASQRFRSCSSVAAGKKPWQSSRQRVKLEAAVELISSRLPSSALLSLLASPVDCSPITQHLPSSRLFLTRSTTTGTFPAVRMCEKTRNPYPQALNPQPSTLNQKLKPLPAVRMRQKMRSGFRVSYSRFQAQGLGFTAWGLGSGQIYIHIVYWNSYAVSGHVTAMGMREEEALRI